MNHTALFFEPVILLIIPKKKGRMSTKATKTLYYFLDMRTDEKYNIFLDCFAFQNFKMMPNKKKPDKNTKTEITQNYENGDTPLFLRTAVWIYKKMSLF